jgi:DNA-binding SARP family transcriptional activator
MRASLSLYLLGPLRAQRDGTVLTLRYNKARVLLAWLALEPGFHTRDALADLLWPTAPTQGGRERLKRMLFHLREVLGDDVIETSRHIVRLNPLATPWLDARDFMQRADASRRPPGHHEGSFTRAQIDAFEQAVRLVRGPFLHGLEVADAPALEQWIDGQRDCFTSRAAALLRDLAHGHVQFGAWREAIAHARRLTTLTPGDESAWQLLIRLLMENDQRDEAAIELARCRDALANTMDATPSAATLALVAPRMGVFAPAAATAALDVRRQVTIVCCELQPAASCESDEIPDLLRLSREETATQLQGAWSYVKRAPSGDLLAYFGYPEATEGSAQRAVTAALDILRALNPTAAERPPGIVARIGVHTALVVSSVRDAVPDGVGAATRIACRLASQAADGEILISDATLQLTRAAFDCAPRGVLVHTGVDAHRVVGARSHPRAVRGVRLVGREREIDALEQARGDCAAVLITGDAGVGKSELVRAYRAAFGLNGVDLACDASSGWLDAFTPQWHSAPPLSGGALLSGLRDGLAREVPAGGVLCIDDLQWADPTTLEFVEYLLLHPLPGRFMILTARTGFMTPWHALNARVLRLEPLPSRAAEALIDSVACGALLNTAARVRIASLGDGVPLYINACVRDALSGSQTSGGKGLTRSAVPADLHDVLMAQLDATGVALPVAQFASAIGVTFSGSLLETALDTTPAALAPMLDALIAHRIIRHVDAHRYAFRYTLLREAAYQSQTREAREAAHSRIDAALISQLDEEAAGTICDCA